MRLRRSGQKQWGCVPLRWKMVENSLAPECKTRSDGSTKFDGPTWVQLVTTFVLRGERGYSRYGVYGRPATLIAAALMNAVPDFYSDSRLRGAGLLNVRHVEVGRGATRCVACRVCTIAGNSAKHQQGLGLRMAPLVAFNDRVGRHER